MLRLHRQDQRSFKEHATLAVTLSMVAGAVNASGLLAAGAMTSHMTGNLTRVGEALARDPAAAWTPLRFIVCFLLGAFCATLGVAVFRRRKREPIAAMLVGEAVLLAAVAQLAWLSERPALVTEMLCFAMGWQNAIVTQISGAVVRTTHVTGTTTDLGIELANVLLAPGKLRESVRAQGWLGALRNLPVDSDAVRALLHGTIIFNFLLGATVGPLLYVRFGYRALVGPAAVLIVLVGVDAVRRASTVRSAGLAG